MYIVTELSNVNTTERKQRSANLAKLFVVCHRKNQKKKGGGGNRNRITSFFQKRVVLYFFHSLEYDYFLLGESSNNTSRQGIG
eukprot:Pgem_evm1s1606